MGLGSNLGDRLAHLRAAVAGLEKLPGARLSAVSPVFETAPVGGPAQGDYLNAVVALEWPAPARALLEALRRLESAAGREHGAGRNLPRTLDLDVLLFGDACIDEPDFRVPHPRLAQRAFVLEPLRRLAPDLVHPTCGETIAALARRLRDAGGVRAYADPDALIR